ncbi:complement C1q-like protein 2 [Dicentrarchus labrax]|uniref:complement C1q-like protein 2 n=1 Tax=Dicentrarchus labrax TaxID=13489 RepID=UPI0021F5716A|nr:complement C1q-like protein 2 [Dicentrarchus labrax]
MAKARKKRNFTECELEVLLTELEAQAVNTVGSENRTAAELKKKWSDMKTYLPIARAFRPQVVESLYYAQTAKLKELELQKAELERQKTEVQRQKIEVQSRKIELEKLKKQLQVKQVAFSASLLASGSGTIGPFNTQTPLVFRHVVSNIGNAYNPNTGFFIATVRGAYHFEIYVAGYGHASHPSAAALIKNGEVICVAYDHRPSNFGSSAHGTTLLLEVGDVVFMRLWANSWIYDDENHYSTFSGHLLFTM